MKYMVLLCDGMADYPFKELEGKTPMELARKPHMDKLAETAEVGLCKTVADGLKPGSDVANLSVMGYDPAVCYTGRSPLEAASMGITLSDTDVALRCNLVTLSDETDYVRKTMVDYCAGDISTPEAAELIQAVQAAFGNDTYAFHPGVSYRHCLIVQNGTIDLGDMTPPHDISGQVVGAYLSKAETAAPLIDMMRGSYQVLKDHPVNQKRIAQGKRPANSIWLWGEGRKPGLQNFEEKNGASAGVVSAVDLIKGIGKLAGMEVAQVPGATGYLDTDFTGKMQAAARMLREGRDLVYVHVEAPDECGHRGEAQNKVRAIELIDEKILGPMLHELEAYDDYRILIMPDHPTPLSTRTHAADPVPFLLYQKSAPKAGVSVFTEQTAAETGLFIQHGPSIMDRLLKG
ncbi:MAG: cofactor-independent phosphoglycerate mutase [Clostridiales bacterium]|nr:cofactor-independent phosphoglycerate mutase [Clostridiales bacterium]